MAKICNACGRAYETRYDWAHHGCGIAGAAREANRRVGPIGSAPPSGQRPAGAISPGKGGLDEQHDRH
jgi:hypothetical protein